MIALRHDHDGARKAFKAGLLLLGILALLLAGSYAAGAKETFPKVLPLPDGFAPEGIATGRGTDFFVGSLSTGALYKGDLRTGDGAILAPAAAGRSLAGLKVDQRTNYVFAAGTTNGTAYVFNGMTGELVQTYQLTTDTPTFINDVVITRDAAYFTDSFQPYIYKLPLGPGGQLPDPSAVVRLELTGDYVHDATPGAFNANGIEATNNGKVLIIVQSVTGFLFTVDPNTGATKKIDLGGDTVPYGDGLLLKEKTLYVVQNQLNQIAMVELKLKNNTGELGDIIHNDTFDIPTTLASFGERLYVVNARFTTPVTPTTEYNAVMVEK